MTVHRKMLPIALFFSALIHAGAAALTMTRQPPLEIEGGHPVSHLVLGQSPFPTVVAGTTASQARAAPVPPETVTRPVKPVPAKAPSPPVVDAQQPLQSPPSKTVEATRTPTEAPTETGPEAVSLRVSRVAPSAFPETKTPRTSTARLSEPPPARKARLPQVQQPAVRPRQAANVDVKPDTTTAADSPEARQAPVQTAAVSAPPKQIEAVDPGPVPPPPIKPETPRQEPAVKDRSTAAKPDRKAPEAAPDTRAGAGGKSARTAQKGGSQKQGADEAAGNSDVTNYPAMIHRRLVRAMRAPRGGRKARQDALVRFTVASNGSVAGVRLVRSSGSTQFDRMVLKAVRSAAPFPPIPAASGKKSWTFTLPVAMR